MARASDDFAELNAKLTAMERELGEHRGMHRRLAELIDVVVEVLLPASLSEDELRVAKERLGQPR